MAKKKGRNVKRNVPEKLEKDESKLKYKTKDKEAFKVDSGDSKKRQRADITGNNTSSSADNTNDGDAAAKKVKPDDDAAITTTTTTLHVDPLNLFSSVRPPLSPCTLEAVAASGFTAMTPVQRAVIPLFLTNKDVCVQAVTGSGKTVAFVIPMVEMLLRNPKPLQADEIGAVVISPTRELARQTHGVARHFCKHAGLTPPLLLVGGTSITEDLSNFHELKSDIIVATPGRLEDILNRYDNILLKSLECLILDEADVLLDMGFEVTLTSILGRLPKMRRTGLFSATSSSTTEGLKSLRRAGLRNPVVVNVAQSSTLKKVSSDPKNHHDKSNKITEEENNNSNRATPSSLTNYYAIAPLTDKLSHLVHFFKTHIIPHNKKCICFFLTCAHVEFYERVLTHLLDSFYLEPLHGKKNQRRREKAMERFRDVKNGGVLLCTDVAARGLDITDIDWVVQFDAPTDPSSYVHRVGRVARAGRTGQSLLLLTKREESYVDFLKGRRVELEKLPVKEGHDAADGDPGEIEDVLPKAKELVMKDRDALEKGTKAFTSHIRAYKEHQCAFIFRFASLDLGQLATSFVLLRLPKMPELRAIATGTNNSAFVPAPPEVDIYAIPFLDKHREVARQKRLAEELKNGSKNSKQIKAEQKKAESARKLKERKEEARQKGYNPNKKKGRNQRLMEEWDDLAKEERLHKKLTRGKITREEYGVLMYGDERKGDEDEMEDSDTDE